MKISKLTKTLFFASVIASIFVIAKGEAFIKTGIGYLIWNLFLAWIPYLISDYFIKKETPLSRFVPLFIIWLIFFPNAPYVITDVIHIYGQTGNLHINSLIFFFFGWLGLILGMISLLEIAQYLKSHTKKVATEATIFGICILSSFGIYLGRFERWNSWDIISHPGEIFSGIFNALDHKPTTIYVITLTLIMYSSYKIIEALREK